MSAFFKNSGSPGAALPWDSPPPTPPKGADHLSAEAKESRSIPLKMCQVSRKQCPPDTENRYVSGSLCFVSFDWRQESKCLISSHQVLRGGFTQQEKLCVPAGQRPSHGPVLVQCHPGRFCQPFTTSQGGDEELAPWYGSQTLGLDCRTGKDRIKCHFFRVPRRFLKRLSTHV